MENLIQVEHLQHRYGTKNIYENLNFSVPSGKIYGLLGKNGVGKTTLIKILMGFLRPSGGRCALFGEDSHDLKPATRAKIGLLFEGHLTYDFMSISQIEKFYAPYYPSWDKDVYYDLVNLLQLSHRHKICHMSCGQRSQVVLGLIMAQRPELLILDDYSMGLDTGYRRLFLDYMKEYLRDGVTTVFLTSHIIQELEGLVDQVIFLERGGKTYSTCLQTFKKDFHCYILFRKEGVALPRTMEGIKNVEQHKDYWEIFSFASKETTEDFLQRQGMENPYLKEKKMSLEDAFVGYTGRY